MFFDARVVIPRFFHGNRHFGGDGSPAWAGRILGNLTESTYSGKPGINSPRAAEQPLDQGGSPRRLRRLGRFMGLDGFPLVDEQGGQPPLLVNAGIRELKDAIADKPSRIATWASDAIGARGECGHSKMRVLESWIGGTRNGATCIGAGSGPPAPRNIYLFK